MMAKQSDPNQVAIVIPARMASSRLPNKPLEKFLGKPLLQWAIEATQGAKKAGFVVVATDSHIIGDWCQSHYPEVELVIDEYRDKYRKIATGSDRVADALLYLRDIDPILIDPSEQFGVTDLKIVINLQCDEPDITGEDLDRMIEFMQSHRTQQVVTFRCPIASCPGANTVDLFTDRLEFVDWYHSVDGWKDTSDIVKVVVDRNHDAIYFSRGEIPGDQHVGVYGFRIAALEQFARLPRSRLEICEDLEQLRLIERGTPIHVLDLDRHVRSVNIPADLDP